MKYLAIAALATLAFAEEDKNKVACDAAKKVIADAEKAVEDAKGDGKACADEDSEACKSLKAAVEAGKKELEKLDCGAYNLAVAGAVVVASSLLI